MAHYKKNFLKGTRTAPCPDPSLEGRDTPTALDPPLQKILNTPLMLFAWDSKVIASVRLMLFTMG